MTNALAAQAKLLAEAREKQRRAADPSVSAWVRANAGTGKTHVLVQRILRLLLSGAEPRSILCLTFTKNAAAEMEARVLAKLGEWATSSEEQLCSLLAELLARAPSETEMALARCLFATVIDAPGGLAVMTIHSFCERVLRRYSFEANVPPGFAVLTEEEAKDALQEACAAAFASASKGPLRDALECVAAYAGERDFASVLEAMLVERSKIAMLFSLTAADDPIPTIEVRLRLLFKLNPSDRMEALLEHATSLLDPYTLREVVTALKGGSANDLKSAQRFEGALKETTLEVKCAALKAAFANGKGEPRTSLMTGAVRDRAGALHEQLVAAQTAFLDLDEKVCGMRLVEASIALLRLTEAIFQRYEDAKRARAALDFDDLIAQTLRLLSRQEAAEWVLCELDARIDHILLDEAQDTSPEQWEIVERLTSDFFAGEGARDCVPTLFAVGDEKQSIYGFQGAKPELLQEYGALYEQMVGQAKLQWGSANLNLSFRTLAPVLAAVDLVSAALPGLRQGCPVVHRAYRQVRGGLVELWEPERGEKQDKGSVWEPDADGSPAAKPAEILASRIAGQIKHWLTNGDVGWRIEPGDILILLRKRAPMAKLLQAALKREGIPVAGTDRIALTGELAVMDLLALADALLQPEDELAVAAVLKGPLFGLDEEDLFKLCYGRQVSLWQALERHPHYAAKYERLKVWRERARGVSPFDFFIHILEAEGGRIAFGARLGTLCYDALDEFLALAETFSARPQASLAEFVSFARKSASEIKRETDQASREVRIMTVHGAKGLEANIVILADACSNRTPRPGPIFLLGDGSGAPLIPIWAVKGTGDLAPVAAAKEAFKAGEQREQSRLLYVAMTRARDRLYVTGCHTGSLPSGSWYDTIQNALAPALEEARDFQGRAAWRMGRAEAIAQIGGPAARETTASPAWLAAPAPKERPLQTLTPSRLMQLAGADARDGSSSGMDRESAQVRGVLIHRLLEVLPCLPPALRERAASVLAQAFASDLAPAERSEAVSEVLALLSQDVLRDGGGLPEAGLGVIVRGETGEPAAAVLGQADRVCLGEGSATVLDFKSGALPEDGIRRAHLVQLACYRLALQSIYPEAAISAQIFDTGSAALKTAADADLDAALKAILLPALEGAL